MLSPAYTEVIPHSTEANPHCTEQALQDWSYPPQYWCYPPNVLNNLQCTESLHSTELTLYGVEFEFATVNWICRNEF